jgi:dolichol-phosphate mannosyltransferase
MTYLSIVAPIYNEEQNIAEFVSRAKLALANISNDFKIIFIDDGSNDNSWKVIKNISNIDNKITGLKLSKNFGHHYAITAGLNHADSEWVVVMDSDLQDRPEVIPQLYQKAQEGFDVVFVSRVNRPESVVYRILQKLFYFILKLSSGIKFDSSQANFSIISRKVVNAFNNFPEQARFYGSTILWLGFKRTSINAEHGTRFKGKPSYSFKKRLRLASDIILAFSDRPLKFAVVIGLFFSVVSLVMTMYVLFRNFFDEFTVTGWASLILSIFLIGGVQISILGIVGIYISKIFNEVKSRPLYLIDEIIN